MYAKSIISLSSYNFLLIKPLNCLESIVLCPDRHMCKMLILQK